MTKLLKKLFTLPIIFYKRCISPWTPASCRHTPTCSSYALEALETHGIIKGLYLSLRRLLRCHPFSKSPHFDPVPPKSASMPNDKTHNFSNSQK